MAFGQGQGGGVMVTPAVDLGPVTWAQLSSMSPGNPLVGGSGGIVDPSQRKVAVASQSTAPVAGAESVQGNWKNLFDYQHNPLFWIALASIAYLGLVHLHVSGTVSGSAGRRK